MRKSVFNRVLIVFCLLFWQVQGNAEQVVDLYTRSVLVINESSEVRKKATVEALRDVFVRISGTVDSLENSRVKAALKDAGSYLDEYRYESSDQAITIAGSEYPAVKLNMKFSAEPLQRLLKEAQLPIWAASRPEILFWLASDNSGKKYIKESAPFRTSLVERSVDRGLPVISPLLDLEDRKLLPASRLWAMDEKGIRLASQRYKGDAILAGKVSERAGKASGSFQLFNRGNTQYFNLKADSPEDLAAQLIDRVSDYFAQAYSVSSLSGNAELLTLRIGNVQGFTDYVSVLKYLAKIPAAESVQLNRADDDFIVVSVDTKGNRQKFLDALELDRKLRSVSNTSSSFNEISVSLGGSNQAQAVHSQQGSGPVLQFEWL